MVTRYEPSGVQAEFEPGSNEEVLKNRLGIKSRTTMDDAEAAALAKTVDALIRTFDQEHRFTAADIRGFHQAWLGNIYEWAGQYRQVNVSKDGFPFAAVAQIPS